tara:strand:+ start:103 stop:909 length:807 start_codon:yes stop_codon:yes gene_type:complete
MSIECLNAALKVEGLPTSSKFVLVVLSNYADENSCCYPSHSHIGKIVGIKDRKHIGKIIKQLEVLGYLKINKRYRDDGGSLSNLYQLSIPSGLQTPPLLQTPTPVVSAPHNTKEDTKDIINIEFERFWKIYPRKVSKFSARLKYQQIVKTYDKDKLYHQLEKFVAHCEAEETDTQFICHCTTFLNQRRFLDYEDIKLEDIKKSTKTTKDKPKWMQEKEILRKQNELRVSSSWSTDKKPQKKIRTNPKASQKLAEIAAKHNIKGKSRSE